MMQWSTMVISVVKQYVTPGGGNICARESASSSAVGVGTQDMFEAMAVL